MTNTAADSQAQVGLRFLRALSQVRSFLARVFGGGKVDEVVAPFVAPPSQPKRPRPNSLTPEPNNSGEFFFRESILDQLDGYMSVVRRMRKYDPAAYSLYRKIGGRILPDSAALFPSEIATSFELEAWWRENRPSFGMVFFSNSDMNVRAETEGSGKMFPRAFAFTKYNSRHAPQAIQPAGVGDVYVCSIYWDEHGRGSARRLTANTSFPVCVRPSGEVVVLKTLETKEHIVRAKRKIRGRAGSFSVPQRKWSHAEFATDWADHIGEDTAAWLRYLFVMTANTYVAASASVTKVKATKGRVTAAFGVNIERTPYFFADREATTRDRSGRKTKIFHIVRAHSRTVNGRDQWVRTHFRGERQFQWNGYQIEISVPGWHHKDLTTFDGGAIDAECADAIAETIAPERLARRLIAVEREGVGAHQRHVVH